MLYSINVSVRHFVLVFKPMILISLGVAGLFMAILDYYIYFASVRYLDS